jgi:hypothetical protein
MMIVEIVGGPKDGEQIEVPEGARHLVIARSNTLAELFVEDASFFDQELTYRTQNLPIEIRRNGSLFVVWTERWDG